MTTFTNTSTSDLPWSIEGLLEAHRKIMALGPFLIGFHFNSEHDMNLVAYHIAKVDPPSPWRDPWPCGLCGFACHITPDVAKKPGEVVAEFSDGSRKSMRVYK